VNGAAPGAPRSPPLGRPDWAVPSPRPHLAAESGLSAADGSASTGAWSARARCVMPPPDMFRVDRTATAAGRIACRWIFASRVEALSPDEGGRATRG